MRVRQVETRAIGIEHDTELARKHVGKAGRVDVEVARGEVGDVGGGRDPKPGMVRASIPRGQQTVRSASSERLELDREGRGCKSGQIEGSVHSQLIPIDAGSAGASIGLQFELVSAAREQRCRPRSKFAEPDAGRNRGPALDRQRTHGAAAAEGARAADHHPRDLARDLEIQRIRDGGRHGVSRRTVIGQDQLPRSADRQSGAGATGEDAVQGRCVISDDFMGPCIEETDGPVEHDVRSGKYGAGARREAAKRNITHAERDRCSGIVAQRARVEIELCRAQDGSVADADGPPGGGRSAEEGLAALGIRPGEREGSCPRRFGDPTRAGDVSRDGQVNGGKRAIVHNEGVSASGQAVSLGPNRVGR